MVPIYSLYLTRSEYGTVDLVITFVNVLLPLISLSIFESALRFALDEKEDKKTIFSTAVMFTAISSVFFFVLTVVLYKYIFDYDYLFFMLAILILQAFQVLLSQFIRALNNLKLYAASGLVLAFTMGLFNIFFLVYYNWKVEGYFLSVILSNIISIILFIIFGQLNKYFDFSKSFNKRMLKRMLMYSIPVIPNALMWWIMNAVSRTLILKYSGIEENGLFAMANKIPSLISMLSTIFFQAWQLLAIREKESEDSSKTYGIIFNYFSKFLIIGTGVLIAFNRPIISFIISNEFYESWKYVPPLLISALFFSFSNFFAIYYNVSKETKGIFTTSLIGGLVNILLSWILIPLIGVYGAAIATIVSFLIIWIFRQRYSVLKFNIVYNNVNVLASIIILTCQNIVLYINSSFELIYEVILLIVLIYNNRELFSPLVIMFKEKEK